MTHSLKILLLTVCLTVLLFCPKGNCAEVSDICKAIRQAEGNSNYGIINGSCDTKVAGMCQYMCEEIVKIRYKEWIGQNTGEFLPYLASKWAPIGVKNDPTGLNRNFLHNVKWFLAKGEK